MLNKIVLMGRLTADVEVRTTDAGKRVANFTLAVDRDYTDKNGERTTDFINCTVWEGKADFLGEWFGKGDSVIVSGSLYVSHYEKDGEKRSAPYVSVSDIYFTGEKKKKGETATVKTDEPQEKKTVEDILALAFDDEGVLF